MTKAVRPCHQVQQGFLNEHFGARIDAAGRLVQDQDAGIGQDGAGDGQQLALPLAEVVALLRDLGLVALGQAADEPIGVGQFGRGIDLVVAGLQPSVADVLHHRAGEQKGVLQHNAQLLADGGLLHGPDVLAIDGDRARVHIVEAAEQIDDGRLARARRADQGDGLAGLGRQADIMSTGLLRVVAKGHPLKGHRALDVLQRQGVGLDRAPMGRASSTSKMRSAPARADCRLLYSMAMPRMGRKKFMI